MPVTAPCRTGEARQLGVSQCIIIACLQKLSMKLAIVRSHHLPRLHVTMPLTYPLLSVTSPASLTCNINHTALPRPLLVVNEAVLPQPMCICRCAQQLTQEEFWYCRG